MPGCLPCYYEQVADGLALLDELVLVPEKILLTHDSDLRALEGQVITLSSLAMFGRFSGDIHVVLFCDT